MKRKILYVIAFLILAGGIMGLIKNLIPSCEWLSFRYFLHGDNSYKLGQLPMYARIYGIIMAILEIVTALLIIMWKSRYFKFCIITLYINMIGYLTAIIIGDFFAISSLIIRIIPLLLLLKVYKESRI